MMKSTILHTNFNVLDLQKSLAFYEKAVGLTEKTAQNSGRRLVYHCISGRR